MTLDEAETILGPDVAARLRAQPCPPLTPEQIDRLAPRLARCEPAVPVELPRTA